MPRAAASGLPRLWLRVDLAPGVSLGPGKVELLRGIDETGSISAAGRRIGMSYKRAWLLVDVLNRHFASPLVMASRGGARGGGASLTPLGRNIVATYLTLQTAAHDAAKGTLAELTAQLRAADDDSISG